MGPVHLALLKLAVADLTEKSSVQQAAERQRLRRGLCQLGHRQYTSNRQRPEPQFSSECNQRATAAHYISGVGKSVPLRNVGTDSDGIVKGT